MKAGVLLLLGAFLSLSSCGGEESGAPPPVNRFQVAQDVCRFERSVPNSITSTVTIDGSVVYGNVSSEAYYQMPTVWASIFATESDTITVKESGGGYCCQWNQGFYYCGYQYCVSQTRHDVSALFGVGRASTRWEAEELAAENCDQIAEQYARSQGRSFIRGLGCEALVTQQCF